MSALPIPSDQPAAMRSNAPLSPEHLVEWRAAQVASKKIRRARRVAVFDGWCVGAFGIITLLCSLLDPGPLGIGMGLGMIIVAVLDFIGARQLHMLEPKAARLLGFNQLLLAAVLIAYALWSIRAAMHDTTLRDNIATQSGGMLEMSDSLESMSHMIAFVIYGSLILIAVFVQGGTALYHFTRRRHIERYVHETPAWILDLQRQGQL